MLSNIFGSLVAATTAATTAFVGKHDSRTELGADEETIKSGNVSEGDMEKKPMLKFDWNADAQVLDISLVHPSWPGCAHFLGTIEREATLNEIDKEIRRCITHSQNAEGMGICRLGAMSEEAIAAVVSAAERKILKQSQNFETR